MAEHSFDDVFPRPDDESVPATPADETPGEDVPAPDEPPAAPPADTPRIVAETPVGALPGVIPPEPEEGTIPASLDVAAREHPAGEPPPPGVSYHPEMDTEPGDVQASELRDRRRAPGPAPAAFGGPAPVDREAAAPVEPPEESAPAPGAGEAAAESPAAPPAEPSTEDTAGADEWDEDISPELASILFASKSKAGTPAAPPKAAPVPPPDAAPPAAPPVPAAPPKAAPVPAAPVPEAPRGPARLASTADARTLSLTAGGASAPPPGAVLAGKVRYARLEEPLNAGADEGQRLRETWSYFKSGLPGLEGRLVTRVEIEEITYADGSWVFRFERCYADRGRDRRDVRANAARTYFERRDEVSTIEPETGKRLGFKEEAALILAAPPHEEKRGFLGTLLGRDEDGSAKTGPEAWREPTSPERRQARKEGGRAFRRSLLHKLLGK